MSIYSHFFILIIGILAIIKSADIFTNAAESIAVYFKIPRAVIGLTIVSIATTMPEFTVSVFSSYMGAGGIAVGNATGSCLANIGLILGTAALINSLHLKPQEVKWELIFLIVCTGILLFLTWDGFLGFREGILLCSIIVVFFSVIIRREIKLRKQQSQPAAEVNNARYNIKKSCMLFTIGAMGVILSAKFAIIPSGIAIAEFLKVPEIVIGISMIAIGTSLPELVTAIIASTKKMGEMAAGNVVGANILNILWVLGFSAMVKPLPIDTQTRFITIPLIIAFSLLLFVFLRTKNTLSRIEGCTLMLCYSGYIVYIVKFAY